MLQLGQVQIDLTQIILAVITLIFGLLMRYVIPSAKKNLDKNQMELLQVAVKSAVYAAEMLYKSDQGQEKKAYVVELLRQQGYIVDPEKIEDSVNAMIEAFVKELKIEQAKIAA